MKAILAVQSPPSWSVLLACYRDLPPYQSTSYAVVSGYLLRVVVVPGHPVDDKSFKFFSSKETYCNRRYEIFPARIPRLCRREADPQLSLVTLQKRPPCFYGDAQ